MRSLPGHVGGVRHGGFNQRASRVSGWRDCTSGRLSPPRPEKLAEQLARRSPSPDLAVGDASPPTSSKWLAGIEVQNLAFRLKHRVLELASPF
jgi:hypothetical protein